MDNLTPEIRDLAEYAKSQEREHGPLQCKLQMASRVHSGYLSVQTTSGGGKPDRTTVRVRDSRRGQRSQYQTVARLDDLRVQDAAGRYVPAREVIYR